jgi:hypothetical protein
MTSSFLPGSGSFPLCFDGLRSPRIAEHLNLLIIRCEIPPLGGSHQKNISLPERKHNIMNFSKKYGEKS